MCAGPRAIVAALLLTAAVVSSAGCEGIAWLSQVAQPKLKAEYKIQDRPTLVVVDDPRGALSDSALRGVLASRIGFEMVRAKGLSQQNLVSQEALQRVAGEAGDAFKKMPLAQIGREAGAEQVIGVELLALDMQAEPGAFRPSLLAQAKLIDVATRQRLFPKTLSLEAGADVPGHPVRSQMFYRVVDADNRAASMAALQQLMARAGREIAHVFVDHERPQPGDPFRD